MTDQELKEFLDFKAEQYENGGFISSDPIQLPHRFERKADIEIIAFLVSTIAWGTRKGIISSGEKLIEIMEHEPLAFINDYRPKTIKNSGFVHRTFNIDDLNQFFSSLHRIYTYSNLEDCFSVHPEIQGVKGRIANFRQAFFLEGDLSRSMKHVSDPLRNSACKRINMYLRWMVRDASKGVDFGIWKSIPTSELYLPLDVHTSRNARDLGILKRKQDDWKALDELMFRLREFDSIDPVKYDFALFGIGAFEKF
jgi:uncharacterized protein (TIGR02757 family)